MNLIYRWWCCGWFNFGSNSCDALAYSQPKPTLPWKNQPPQIHTQSSPIPPQKTCISTSTMAVYPLSSLPPPLLSHPKLNNSITNTSFSPIHSPQKTVTIRRVRNRIVSATKSVDGYAVGEDLPADYADWLPKVDSGDRRRAGVLLHPTSFRGPYGIGDLGDQAFQFIDWLHQAGCSLWQVCIASMVIL